VESFTHLDLKLFALNIDRRSVLLGAAFSVASESSKDRSDDLLFESEQPSDQVHIGAERLGDGKRQLGRVASMLSGMRGYLDEE
jgi:hypothetical protein